MKMGTIVSPWRYDAGRLHTKAARKTCDWAVMCASQQLTTTAPQVAGSANDRTAPIDRTFGFFSCDPRENAGLFAVATGSLFDAASLEVNHTRDHCPMRVEGQVLESPSPMECAHLIVDWVRNNAEAPDLAGGSERRPEREQEERAGMALSLMMLVDRKLSEQGHWNRGGFVALL